MCFDGLYLSAYDDIKSLDNVDMPRLNKCLRKAKVCMFFSHIDQYTLRTAVSTNPQEEFEELKDISRVEQGSSFYEIRSPHQVFYVYMKCFLNNEVRILTIKKQKMVIGGIIELTKNDVLKAIRDFSGRRPIIYKSEDIVIFKSDE